MDIKREINSDIVKKIFGNKDNALKFIKELGVKDNLQNLSAKQIYNYIVDKWNYEDSREIIRNLFKETIKYKNGQDGENSIHILISEWKELKLGEISWPFSQGQFDNYVQRINSSNSDRNEKDNNVKLAALKYRRIKEINTVRNDYLETLIYNKNKNIIPTLSHSRGVDFFIDGISYDQKVAKSPTEQFKRKYGQNWKKQAINNPALVAEYLYKHQDEGRFGKDPRLYIVYLDEKITPIDIKKVINSINLTEPHQITFKYKHKDLGEKSYRTQAFVILLHSTN